MIQGAVSVFIHETNFIITTGGMFLVPRGLYAPAFPVVTKLIVTSGNMYYIQNIAEREAKLFFTQARMTHPVNGTEAYHTSRSAPPSSHRRAVSIGKA